MAGKARIEPEAGKRARRPRTVEVREPSSRPVRINLRGRELVSLGRVTQEESMRWSYVLLNRERWNTQSGASLSQQAEMCALAARLGLGADPLRAIAAEGLVEVSIPFAQEASDWELRIFPWEFLLDAATREFRGQQPTRPLTVVRHLDVPRAKDGRKFRARPTTWLQVISAPGALDGEYDFEGESRLLAMSIPAREDKFEVVHDPDVEMLGAEIRRRSPDVIHLSGFDTHQGLAILDPNRTGSVFDGYLLRASGREPEADPADRTRQVPSQELAEILTSGSRFRPMLVACNLYNSAARTAALAVAYGAQAAVGFQDSFDDELAELFFNTLYRSWGLAGWNIVSAFDEAWRLIRTQSRPLQGSGVVLWTEQSIAKPGTRAEVGKPKTTPPTAETIREDLGFVVTPFARLNYSSLHNNGPLFERFRIEKKRPDLGRVDGIEVKVELYVGTDSYPWRLRATLEETASHLDLIEEVRVSLASNLSRGARESIHTSLYAEVAWRDQVLYRATHRVTLLPVDEWRFDGESYRWLPSFVLPRDPAVLRVVDAAQRYLMALRDDATAGFDGYQCVLDAVPGKVDDCEQVDLQVRALWSALLYETPLSYINPPPTFTETSQRLRTPSDCLDGRRGTCIDLALLLAACLEYVDIYPAIFLLNTHAFPAYWRHSSYHQAFCEARGEVPAGSDVAQGRQGQNVSWVLRKPQYREILGEIQAGRLVPLETTLVTGRGSFAEAMALGAQNLAAKREFESMVDILLARTDEKSSVTPLPMRRSES